MLRNAFGVESVGLRATLVDARPVILTLMGRCPGSRTTVTIDETTLALLDKLAAAASGGRTRSAVVRAAVQQLAARERRRETEAQERAVLRKHRKHLDRALRAPVAAQARP